MRTRKIRLDIGGTIAPTVSNHDVRNLQSVNRLTLDVEPCCQFLNSKEGPQVSLWSVHNGHSITMTPTEVQA